MRAFVSMGSGASSPTREIQSRRRVRRSAGGAAEGREG